MEAPLRNKRDDTDPRVQKARACNVVYMAKRRQTDPERVKADKHADYLKHAETRRAYGRAYKARKTAERKALAPEHDLIIAVDLLKMLEDMIRS